MKKFTALLVAFGFLFPLASPAAAAGGTPPKPHVVAPQTSRTGRTGA